MSKNTVIKIFIAIILLSIGYWTGFAVSSADGIQEVILIHGREDNWEVKDFKVIKYKNKFQWGSGKIKYYGDGKNLDDLVGFQFEIVKNPIGQNGRSNTLYFNSVESNTGFSVGGETAAVTFGKIENDQYRIIDIENYESNISGKEDYIFDDNYSINVKIYLKYIDGKEIEDEFPLEMIVINDGTFNEIHVQSKSK